MNTRVCGNKELLVERREDGWRHCCLLASRRRTQSRDWSPTSTPFLLPFRCAYMRRRRTAQRRAQRDSGLERNGILCSQEHKTPRSSSPAAPTTISNPSSESPTRPLSSATTPSHHDSQRVYTVQGNGTRMHATLLCGLGTKPPPCTTSTHLDTPSRPMGTLTSSRNTRRNSLPWFVNFSLCSTPFLAISSTAAFDRTANFWNVRLRQDEAHGRGADKHRMRQRSPSSISCNPV